MVYNSMDLLVCEQALIQTLIQEIIVKHNYFIDSFDLFQVIFELVEVRFEHFEQHIVQIVLAELKHLVARSISLRKHFLDVALLGRLMDAPCLLQTVLNVLLEEQVPEDKLILIYYLLGDDQAQGPLHLALEGEGFVDLHSS